MRPADNINELIKKLKLKASAELDKRVHDDISRALTKSEKTKSVQPEPNIWRIIMKSSITKLAASAAIIIAIFVGINQFGGSIKMESVAFADVMQNIQNARTLTYRNVITSADQDPQVTKTMVLEPHLMRVELPDGKVWILDHGQGKTLILDSKNKEAVISTTLQKTLGLYDTFRNFRNVPDFPVSRIGQRTIDGMQAVGFQLTRENGENVIIVWADPQTSLPIRIERTVKDENGQVIKSVTTNIIFDAELDQSLFRLEGPEGYSRRFIDGPFPRPFKLRKRSRTASNMLRILLTCIMYAQDHEGQWPNSLQDLTEYGIVKGTLINPRQPEREIGYVYLRPSTPISPQQVVLYEAHDSWGDGINVGFVDGHVEFIEKESMFKNRLEDERTVKLTKRMKSAKNMQKILLACIVYAKDHEDQWPDSLQDLTQRRLARDTLINPRQPEREIGYVYVKPRTPFSPSQIVLYEKYDLWGDGINVGYADVHVQFIKEESYFKNELENPFQPR